MICAHCAECAVSAWSATNGVLRKYAHQLAIAGPKQFSHTELKVTRECETAHAAQMEGRVETMRSDRVVEEVLSGG